MKNVKTIFVALLVISSLTSFVSKDKIFQGLRPGEFAPNFMIASAHQGEALNLKDLNGKYVLLSFWASYDANSRVSNTSLYNAVSASQFKNIEMVSVSFDEYESVFEEVVRLDQLSSAICMVDTKGPKSTLYNTFRMKDGFSNYLLDENGVIVAKNISAGELAGYLN